MIITPERFSQGYSWEQYVARIRRNRELFQKSYDSVELTDEETEWFERFRTRLTSSVSAKTGARMCMEICLSSRGSRPGIPKKSYCGYFLAMNNTMASQPPIPMCHALQIQCDSRTTI